MKSTARMGVALVIFLVGSFTSSVVARQQSSNQPEPLARRTDIYCTGFIADTSSSALKRKTQDKVSPRAMWCS